MTTKINEAAKAAALVSETEAEAKADAQFKADREVARTAILTEAEKMGGQYAAGQMSLTHLAYLFSNAVSLRFATETDAADLYKAYAKGNNDAVETGFVMVGNVQYRVSGHGAKLDGADKSPVNNLRTFGRLAAAVQGLGLYEKVIEVRRGIDRELVAGSEYVCMVRVNRALSKLADDKAITDDELRAGSLPMPTDDELRTMITKEEAAKKDFDAKLEAALKALASLVKAGDANTHGLRKIYDQGLIVQADYRKSEAVRKAKENRAAEAPHPTLPNDAKTEVVQKDAA